MYFFKPQKSQKIFLTHESHEFKFNTLRIFRTHKFEGFDRLSLTPLIDRCSPL